jgi:hypothetical protein
MTVGVEARARLEVTHRSLAIADVDNALALVVPTVPHVVAILGPLVSCARLVVGVHSDSTILTNAMAITKAVSVMATQIMAQPFWFIRSSYSVGDPARTHH